MKILVIDALTVGEGHRRFTRDFIGAGPRYISGFIEVVSNKRFSTTLMRVEKCLDRNSSFLKSFPIICISAMSMDAPVIHKILNKIGKNMPKSSSPPSSPSYIENNDNNLPFILLGGPISLEYDSWKKINVDAILPGEAEPILYYLFHEKAEELLSMKKSPKDILSDVFPYVFSNKNGAYKDERLLLKVEYLPENIKTKILSASEWFENSSGYPEKIDAYSDYQFARIYVECVRGCSNFRRMSLSPKKGTSCSDNSCSVCRGHDFSTRMECPSNIPPGCGFCSTIAGFGFPRSRNIQKILEEIKTLIKMGAHRIVLGAPDFLDLHRNNPNFSNNNIGEFKEKPLIHPTKPEPNYSALENLVDGIISIPAVKNGDVQIFVENVKAGLCTDRALDIISKLPNPILSVGCETGSDEFADMIGRPNSPSESYNAIKRMIEHGIRVHVYFIHSLPGDNEKFSAETLNFLNKLAALNIEKITLYKYQHLPGSPFYLLPKHYFRFSKKTLQNFKKIKRFTINYNRKQKERLLNKRVRVYIAEKNNQRKNDAMGWLLEGGPKISIQNGFDRIGSFVWVRIIRVISDRLLEAIIDE